jgi:hypothetical protein
MPFKLLDPIEKIYIVTVSYRGKEYRFEAKMYHYYKGIETWYIKSKSSEMITVTFDTDTKAVNQFFLYHEKKPAPDDFLEALRKELENRTISL